MSILLPDAGLLFWMLVAFGIVFFILSKFVFPAITTLVDERKRFIDEALQNAKDANANIEVLEPLWLRKEMAGKIKRMWNKYKS